MNPQIVRRTLLENTNLCEDIIDMIIEFVFPKKFYKNTIYQMYDRTIQDKHEIIPVFISKINKKSVRDTGISLGQSIYIIPLKDVIEYGKGSKNPVYERGRTSNVFTIICKDRTSIGINENFRIIDDTLDDMLVYKDDTYLYYSYRRKNRHRLLNYSQEKQRIYDKYDKHKRSIHPWDTFDKTKYEFINIPHHLKNFFTDREIVDMYERLNASHT